VAQNVVPTGTRAGKAAATDRTHKRFFARVNSHVRVQVGLLCKRLGADAALPRPLQQVDRLMVSKQLLTSREPLRALAADMVAFVRVSIPHVQVEGLRRAEHSVACGAGQLSLLVAVDQVHVSPEIGLHLECPTTLWAKERPQVGVPALVKVALSNLAEPFGATRCSAGKWTFTGVSEHVTNQRLAKLELATTHRAKIRTLLSPS